MGPDPKPFGNRSGIEVDEDAFPKLFYRGQPIGTTRYWGTANTQLNILNIAISSRRRRFKSRETVEARYLPQSMHGDQVFDPR